MPFEPLVTAVIETSLNTLIKDDPSGSSSHCTP